MTRRKCFSTFFLVCLMATLSNIVSAADVDIVELRTKAEHGDSEAQYRLGRWYDSRFTISCWPFTTKDNLQEAIKWWFKAAKQGHVRAQYELARSYALGLGVKEDPLESALWYHKAAENGFSAAQYMLGKIYSTGNGVPLNKQEAIKWWLKAAEKGDIDSCYNLGVAYADGDGVDKDLEEAIRWFLKSKRNIQAR